VEIIEWAVNPRSPARWPWADSFHGRSAALTWWSGVEPLPSSDLFLDTGFHFPETLSVRGCASAAVTTQSRCHAPEVPLDEFPCGSGRCCELRKVVPLAKVLRGHSAWITGLKRVDTPERAEAPVIAGTRAATS